MPFTFNGNTPEIITYNGNDVEVVTYNGVVVWTKASAGGVSIEYNGQVDLIINGTYAAYTTISLNTSSIPSTASITSCKLSFYLGDWYKGTISMGGGATIPFPPAASVGKPTVFIRLGTSNSDTLLAEIPPADYEFYSEDDGVPLTSLTKHELDLTSALSAAVASQSSISLFLRAYINDGTVAHTVSFDDIVLTVKYN